MYPNLKEVAVYCGSKSVDNPIYANVAADLACLMAANDIALVYGGSCGGIMGVLADTMIENGGRVIGVFSKSIRREFLHPGLTETVVTDNLAARKNEMICRSDASIAFPGGLGTFDELFDSIARRMVCISGQNHPIGILNVNGYYDLLHKFLEHTIDVGFTREDYKSLLFFENRPADLLAHLNDEIGKRS